MVGLFALEGGVFYGGGFKLLGTQAIGTVATGIWALGLGFLLFYVIKKTVGVRVAKRVEEEGLDVYEHGESAYN
jgi:Amt family ammonium transporter